jgi:hypothetical protein
MTSYALTKLASDALNVILLHKNSYGTRKFAPSAQDLHKIGRRFTKFDPFAQEQLRTKLDLSAPDQL